MAAQCHSQLIQFGLDEYVEALEEWLRRHKRTGGDLLKNVHGFFFISELAVHLEGEKVDLQLVSVALLDVLTAPLDQLASPFIVP